MPTLDCLHRHIFLLHVYRGVSLARMRRYMQLAYLFHQCAKSLLNRDSRIADCTVRHPGVERPFSSECRACDFLCVGLLVDYLWVRLHGVIVREYETLFNANYFIINNKITALCSCNCSAVLTYLHTKVAVY